MSPYTVPTLPTTDSTPQQYKFKIEQDIFELKMRPGASAPPPPPL